MKKLVILLNLIGALLASDAPNSLGKFKQILKVSKLQAPTSHYDKKYATKYGKFKNFSNKYFYLKNDSYMILDMCQNKKEKRRSELRGEDDWKIDTRISKTLEAKLKITPYNKQTEFTFLQIHSDGTLKNIPIINLPLLRIAWRKNYKGIKNHIWAILRLNPNIKRYKKVDLGILPQSFFDMKLKVQSNNLTIYKDSIKMGNYNVSSWKKYMMYFKAGVYLQGIGCAKVSFDKLMVL